MAVEIQAEETVSAVASGTDQEENFDAVGTPEEEAAHGVSIEDWVDEDTKGEEGIPEARPREGKQESKTEKGKKEAAKPELPYDPKARVKVKVDGEEIEVTLDQAVREYRRRQAADKRFQEASAARKAAEELTGRFKADPWEAMRQLGIDPDKAATERILAKIEEEKLASENPSELERRRAVKQVEEERAAKETLQKQIEEAKLGKARDEIRAKIDKQFTAALKDAKLPPTPYTVARMADVVAKNLREDPHWDATPAELALLVKEDLQEEFAHVIRDLSPEQIEALLGEKTVKALRQHDLERVKNPKLQSEPRKVIPLERGERPKRKQSYTDPDDAAKALEEWARG